MGLVAGVGVADSGIDVEEDAAGVGEDTGAALVSR
jgi:ABC-type transporter Mla maintaining outer membrane lipid asymmetry permease subunit MlaE